MNRRTMLKEMSAVTVGAAIRKYSRAEAQESEGASKFFPGFKTFNFRC